MIELLNIQMRGGLIPAPRNLVTFSFFPGDELDDKLGLTQSEAGTLFGESLIFLVWTCSCLNNHLNGFYILEKVPQYENINYYVIEPLI